MSGYISAVYGLSALLVIPILVSGKGISSPLNIGLMAVFTFVPSAVGIAFVRITRTSDERRDFWQRVFHWPSGHAKFGLIGMLILPFNVLVSYGLASWLSAVPIDLSNALRVLLDWKTLLLFLFVEFSFGPISEELGWRGYALDELQTRWSALSSSVILGSFWAFWHTPTFLIPGTSQYAMGGILSWNYPVFIVSIILGSVIHTWAYNNTRHSILVAGVLMHFTQNIALIFLGGLFEEFSLPPTYWPILLLITGITAGVLVLVYRPQKLMLDSK